MNLDDITARLEAAAHFNEMNGRLTTVGLCREAAETIRSLSAALAEATAIAREAITEYADTIGYAAEYFQEKWSMHETLAGLRARLAVLDQPTPTPPACQVCGHDDDDICWRPDCPTRRPVPGLCTVCGAFLCNHEAPGTGPGASIDCDARVAFTHGE
jgi:hypothetical protein